MTRFAKERRVFFFEEPIFAAAVSELRITRDQSVYVCVPHLSGDLSHAAVAKELRRLLVEMHTKFGIERPAMWYYTPMALAFARDIAASAIVFDCMDELSA